MFDQSSTFTLRMVGYVCPKLNLHPEDGGVGLPKAQPPPGGCWGYFDQSSTLVLGWTFNDCSAPKEHHILGAPLLLPKNTTFWEHLVLGWTFNDCSAPKEHHILEAPMYRLTKIPISCSQRTPHSGSKHKALRPTPMSCSQRTPHSGSNLSCSQRTPHSGSKQAPLRPCLGGSCYFDQSSTLVLGWTFNDCSAPKEHHILGTPKLRF